MKKKSLYLKIMFLASCVFAVRHVLGRTIVNLTVGGLNLALGVRVGRLSVRTMEEEETSTP